MPTRGSEGDTRENQKLEIFFFGGGGLNTSILNNNQDIFYKKSTHESYFIYLV